MNATLRNVGRKGHRGEGLHRRPEKNERGCGRREWGHGNDQGERGSEGREGREARPELLGSGRLRGDGVSWPRGPSSKECGGERRGSSRAHLGPLPHWAPSTEPAGLLGAAMGAAPCPGQLWMSEGQTVGPGTGSVPVFTGLESCVPPQQVARPDPCHLLLCILPAGLCLLRPVEEFHVGTAPSQSCSPSGLAHVWGNPRNGLDAWLQPPLLPQPEPPGTAPSN